MSNPNPNPEMAALEEWNALSALQQEIFLGAMLVELKRLSDTVEHWLPRMRMDGNNTVVVPITLSRNALSKWSVPKRKSQERLEWEADKAVARLTEITSNS